MISFNINSDDFVVLANKLEKLKRSSLPIVVRGTLNSLAFQMKTDDLIKSSESNFENRYKNFFKANSTFKKASGFDINSMQSAVGFIKKKANYAIDDLANQEEGGTIEKRSFIAFDSARKGKTNKGLILPNARLKAIKNIKDARKGTLKSSKANFNQAVFSAGKGGFVLSEWKDKNILWRINSLNKTKENRYKLTAMYSYTPNRKVNVKATNFMQEAQEETEKLSVKIFEKEAKREFDKF